MRCLLGLLVLIVGVVPVPAGDAPKANNLTPQEVKDGWLLLFDGETTFGWKIEGEAKVEKSTLILGGTKETKATFSTMFYLFDFYMDCLGDNPEKTESKAKLVLTGSQGETRNSEPVFVGRVKGWSPVHVSVTPSSNSAMVMGYFTRGGGSLSRRGMPNAESVLSVTVPAGTTLSLRNIKLKPLGAQPLFNGKDLFGWNVFPGKKSKFTVNNMGELNVKDGPGDLQTEKAFGDFIFQGECISNGKFLNSGVFFRCIPGQYQNGYECQIRNEFKAEPNQTYVIEQYDPKTHKVISKDKVKYTAVDYGTGAMYRRQPARKEVAKDGEWFTLTIVAHGNHFASWVNGIQVTDWTDHRPANDNPRNGFRAQAGPLSLQGHDPTTNLSFRNFRVAEFPVSAEKK